MSSEPLTFPEAPRAGLRWPLDVSVVVPTFNERGNVEELLRRLSRVLDRRSWEVVFVDDDSPDGTSGAIRAIAARDPRVRVLQRIGRRGLSSACIEGMLASAAPVIAVMDADLQHDEALLPRMLETIHAEGADVVIGSRYVAGGSVGAWDASRAKMSRFATALAEHVLPVPVADPMSGFFMLRREVLDERVRGLSGLGFKILLDLLTAKRAPLKVVELPFTFRARHAGESKLDSSVAWDFLMLIGDRTFGRWVPVRFVAFAAVGGAGVFVHFAVLTMALKALGLAFAVAQAAAAGAAMVFNYTVNNLLTFRDRRLHGWRWWKGLASFVLACGIGAVANVGVSAYLFERRTEWVLAALAGIAVGAVWNYAVTNAYTWKSGKPK
jgi:dolichol-phosphate mannosyltransferase